MNVFKGFSYESSPLVCFCGFGVWKQPPALNHLSVRNSAAVGLTSSTADATTLKTALERIQQGERLALSRDFNII